MIRLSTKRNWSTFSCSGVRARQQQPLHHALQEELRALELEFHESLQGRARWPLVRAVALQRRFIHVYKVAWKTLLLGRNMSSNPGLAASQPPPPQTQRRQPKGPEEQAASLLGAPRVRAPYSMQGAAVHAPQRGGLPAHYLHVM